MYTPASATDTWKRQLSAALATHPGSIVGGKSAALLHGFPNFNPTRPELLAAFGANARSAIARIIRSRHFDLVARTNRQGFDCTTPAETILTLSLRLPPNQIERIVDNELAAKRLSVDAFDPILDRLRFARQPGLKSLRRIVGSRADQAYQPPTSELEKLLYGLLDHDEIPAYERQLPIAYSKLKATVDAYIHDWRAIVEADGRRWHTREADFVRDRERDNAALAAGLVVVRFTWHQLRYEPNLVLRTLIDIGKQRSSP